MPAGPINTVADVFDDPQVQHRGMKIEIDNARAAGGTTPGLRSGLVIDGAAMASGRPAPALGQHTQEVLSDPDWV